MAPSTRDQILRTLRINLKCTVKDLAQSADVSPVSVRHHLNNLQAEGMVRVEEKRHGVGRPKHLFSLTDKALELFPTRYYRLANRILEEMKESLPASVVKDMFAKIAVTMTETLEEQLDGLPLNLRLETLQELLQEEGFEIAIEKKDNEIIIHELCCPYFKVGQAHPEICVIDRELLSRSLDVPVEQVTSVLDGDAHCNFCIKLENTQQEPQSHD